jgi:hypothetical protein
MRVPVITRRDPNAGNPGDGFILWGLQDIWDEEFGLAQWDLISKFGPEDIKASLKEVSRSDILVYAGMPQFNNYDDWCLFYDKELWEDYITPTGMPPFPLAGGGGFPNLDMTPTEFADYCMASEKTVEILTKRFENAKLITVRDHHAYELVKRIRSDVELQPCTAILAAARRNVTANRVSKRVALVPPTPNMFPDKYVGSGDTGIKMKGIFDAFVRIRNQLLKAGYEPVIVCHGRKEFEAFRAGMRITEVFYTNCADSLLRYYGTCEAVVSARLHGAVCAYGIPGTKVVGIGIDTRMSAFDLFPGIVQVKWSDFRDEDIVSHLDQAKVCTVEELTSYRTEYQACLRGGMER